MGVPHEEVKFLDYSQRRTLGWRKTPVLDRILSPIQAQGWGGVADESMKGMGFSPGYKHAVA